MPDLGYRENVMGPQPISARKPMPADMLAAVDRFLSLLRSGDANALREMAVENTKDQVANLAASVKPGAYDDRKVLASARTNEHYWVKAKLTGPDIKPFIVQLRLGNENGKWLIWQTMNLTDARSAWTK